MAQQEPVPLPDQVQQKFEAVESQINQITQAARQFFTADVRPPISFSIENSSVQPHWTLQEVAQSVSFIMRFQHLQSERVEIETFKDQGKHHIDNLSLLRHVLNDFRPLIQNQSDSVHYQKIHRLCYVMLAREDPHEGTVIRVSDEMGNDITPTYTRWLVERKKAISFVLRLTEFGYLYNGILQHSNPQYTQRYLDDYTSGELNYILVKHVYILHFIWNMLLPYFVILRYFTFPKPGPL